MVAAFVLAPAPSNKLRAPFSCSAGVRNLFASRVFSDSSEACAWRQTSSSSAEKSGDQAGRRAKESPAEAGRKWAIQ
jgi:hypothetical protein